MPALRKGIKKVKQLRLSIAEQGVIDKVVRQQQGTPGDAILAVQRDRTRQKRAAVNKSTVYWYLNGRTCRCGLIERRGRKKALSARDGL